MNRNKKIEIGFFNICYLYIPNGRFMKESREHILFTSLMLFMQKGFKEVTMQEIVDKTGLSKGAFYHYFSSKEHLFTEVIDHYFTGVLALDYSRLDSRSLLSFYSGLLDQHEKNSTRLTKMFSAKGDEAFQNNFFYLLFDAMRMLPDFKQQHALLQKQELSAWKSVVATARKSKEISTVSTDEQVAKIFIFLGDGTNVNLVLGEQVHKKKNELKTLWNALYNTLKA